MRKRIFISPLMLVFSTMFLIAADAFAAVKEANTMVQAGIILTVPESKRLIAKGVLEMPIVKNALKHGKIIITKGTTNTCIAEELLAKSIAPGAYVYGKITPENNKSPFPEVPPLPEVIFVKGEYKPEMTLEEALEKLEPGDVVIKGGNALDYENKTAAVMIGSPTAGTTGKIMPYVVARKAHLVIPIGLEKQISANVKDMHLKMREPMESLNDIPSMFLLTGHIVTELEAMNLLAGVETFQAAAGGVGGAEGGVWLIVRGNRENVEKALQVAYRVRKDAANTKE